MKNFFIENHLISQKSKPFIIAEMSANHNNSLSRALSIVESAAKAGAHAIKLQTYTADTMTLNVNHPDFIINDKKSLWNGRHLYELYKKAHTPWEWHYPLMEHAKKLGIVCFSTPFDSTAVDFLEELNVPAYKIGSFENTDIQLIRKICSTKKPIIISVGMASLEELDLIVKTLRSEKCENFVLLKCTSVYPASPSDANLRTIPHLSDMFNCQVGLSDHTMGIGVPLAAIAMGATVVEKHFCLSRAEGGVDSSFSMEPSELKLLVEESEKSWLALGKVSYERSCSEEGSKQFKRSLYFVKNMKVGEKITEDCIKSIRPGGGLEPKYYKKILLKNLKRSVRYGDPVKLEFLI